MFCTHCGKEIPNEAKFCRYCGSQVTFVKPPVVVKVSAETKEEEPVQENFVPQTEAIEELDAVTEEEKEAEIIKEKIETNVTKPEEFSPISYQAPPFQSEPVKQKKISPIVLVVIIAGVLLIGAICIIVSLLGKLNNNDVYASYSQRSNNYEYSEDNYFEKNSEATDYFEYPELSHEFDGFLDSNSFNKDAVLEEGEILYMGEAFYDGIGECHVTFILGIDRKTIKNFAIYLNNISLELSQNGSTYDLSGLSIRQDFNNSFEYSEDYSDVLVGGNTMYGFILDTEGYSYAYGGLDYSFTYYPTSFGGGTSQSIETYLGTSDVCFVPVRIG